MLIHEVLHQKPVVVGPEMLVREAVLKLITDHINGLLVVNEKQEVLGVLALQDIAAATIPIQFRKNVYMAAAMYRRGFFSEQCQEIMDLPITQIMRKNFIAVSLQDNIMAVMADFLKNDLYIVPVIDKGKLVGVVTRSEIKHALAYGMGLPSKYWKVMKGQ
ncbi:MAG: HPP family protein [Patescibacteria group bacterium]